MKNLIILLMICQVSMAQQTLPPQHSLPKTTTKPQKQANLYAKAKISYKLIPAEANTWGYDIYIDDKLSIHQPARPAMPGNEGFATQNHAQKVADFVVKKIRSGGMPPTISPEELKKLGVL